MSLKTKRKKKTKTPKQRAVEEADKYFSLYIRLKYADWRGYVKCYTCDKVLQAIADGMQCGHFVSRSCHKLRWDENNARPQCYGCNISKKGNYIEYTLRLIKELGKKKVDELAKLGKDLTHMTTADYQRIAKKYKDKYTKIK